MKNLILLVVLSWAILLGAAYVAVRAEPPPGADPELAPFYQSLKQPGTGAICCSMSDCRTVVTRIHGGKVWAFVGGGFRDSPNNWEEVPENVKIHGVENQAGEPVLCWYGGKVRCFLDAGRV